MESVINEKPPPIGRSTGEEDQMYSQGVQCKHQLRPERRDNLYEAMNCKVGWVTNPSPCQAHSMAVHPFQYERHKILKQSRYKLDASFVGAGFLSREKCDGVINTISAH